MLATVFDRKLDGNAQDDRRDHRGRYRRERPSDMALRRAELEEDGALDNAVRQIEGIREFPHGAVEAMILGRVKDDRHRYGEQMAEVSLTDFAPCDVRTTVSCYDFHPSQPPVRASVKPLAL